MEKNGDPPKKQKTKNKRGTKSAEDRPGGLDEITEKSPGDPLKLGHRHQGLRRLLSWQFKEPSGLEPQPGTKRVTLP